MLICYWFEEISIHFKILNILKDVTIFVWKNTSNLQISRKIIIIKLIMIRYMNLYLCFSFTKLQWIYRCKLPWSLCYYHELSGKYLKWCALDIGLSFIWQVQEPDLGGVSHLLVDEIHERGMNEDFLIIILRDLLPRRPDLRLILMSATINADLFSKYFENAPTIHIPVLEYFIELSSTISYHGHYYYYCFYYLLFTFAQGLTFPVAEMFLEDVLEKTRYKIVSETDNFVGGSRRRRQLSSKSDPLTEMFEVKLKS